MSTIFWIFSGIILVVVLGATVKAIIDYYNSIKDESKTSFKQSIDLIGLPIVTFYQGKEKYNFLIDTGSSGCHIDIKCIPEGANPAGSAKIMGVEGNYRSSNTYNVALYLNNKKYYMECAASDMSSAFNKVKEEYGITLHGIVGSNFFNAYNYIIDFEKYIFYTNKK